MRSRTAQALALVLIVGAPAAARADVAKPVDKKICIAAAERGQELKNEGKLRDARGQFALCAQKSCPTTIVAECERWGAEAENALGSVKLEAFDGQNKPLTNVRIVIDGAPRSDEIPATSLLLDPGSHEIRFEHGSDAPVVRTVSLAMGERDVVVRATFAPAPASTAPTPAPAPAPVTRPPPERSGGSLVPAVVAGGVGLAAIGAATAFWLLGNANLDDTRARCGAGCAEGEADSAKQQHLIGDIALGVGVVAIALSAYFVLTREKAPQPILLRF